MCVFVFVRRGDRQFNRSPAGCSGGRVVERQRLNRERGKIAGSPYGSTPYDNMFNHMTANPDVLVTAAYATRRLMSFHLVSCLLPPRPAIPAPLTSCLQTAINDPAVVSAVGSVLGDDWAIVPFANTVIEADTADQHWCVRYMHRHGRHALLLLRARAARIGRTPADGSGWGRRAGTRMTSSRGTPVNPASASTIQSISTCSTTLGPGLRPWGRRRSSRTAT